MAVKKGLGRGFDSLIPTQLLDDTFDPTAEQDSKVSAFKQVLLANIQPDPHQPRRHFDEEALDELSSSIKVHGLIQPLVLVPDKDGRTGYIIVAGERRWRAAGRAGLTEVPAIVRTLSDQHKLEIALIENLQRKDLNRLEEATAYLKLSQQFNMRYDDIAKRVGKALSTVSNILRLLNLPLEAKEALVEQKITEGHARQILAIDAHDVQMQLLGLIVDNDWSVRKTEQFVIGYKDGNKTPATGVAKTRTETDETKVLASRLAAPVQVKAMAKGGQLIIRYKSDEDLERIYQQLL